MWAGDFIELLGRKIESGADIAAAQLDLFTSLANAAVRIKPATRSCVCVYEERDKAMRFVAVAGRGWTDELRTTALTLDQETASAPVAQTRNPFVIGDLMAPQYLRLFPDTRSHESAPFLWRSRAAVLSVDSEGVDVFHRRQLSRLKLLTAEASMVLEHYALIEDKWLLELDKFLLSTVDLTQLCKEALGHIMRLFGVLGCSIFLKYPTASRLRLASTTAPEAEVAKVPTYRLGDGLTGWVAKHRRILRLRDVTNNKELRAVAEDLKWKHIWSEVDYPGRKTFLAAPLTARDTLIGVVRLSVKEKDADFTANDEQLIESLAGRLALAVQNIWLKEESDKRFHQLTAFTRLGGELAESMDLQRVGQVILEEALRILHCEAGHIRIFHKATKQLQLLASIGPQSKWLSAIRKLGEGIAGKVAMEKKPRIIQDVSKNQDFIQVLQDVIHRPQYEVLKWIRSEACFPLIVQGELVATLSVHSANVGAFGNEEKKLLRDLANRGAVAIHAARMYRRVAADFSQRQKVAALLSDGFTEFTRTLNLDRLLAHVLDAALEESRLDLGTIRILSEGGGEWLLKAAKDVEVTPPLMAALPVVDDLLNRAAKGLKSTYVDNAKENREFQQFVAKIADPAHRGYIARVHSFLIVPMQLKDRQIGYIFLGSRVPQALGDRRVDSVERLAAHAAVAVSNAELYAQRERAQRLSEPLAIMGGMLGSFLHATRNGLHRLTGILDNMDFTGPHQLKMREQIRTMERVLSEVALFSGKGELLSREPVDVNAAIQRAVRDHQARFNHKISCKLRLSPSKPMTLGNRVQIEQSFGLIIDNAIEAMPAGGTLNITISIEKMDLLVAFQDSGIGMDAVTRSRCLEPFFTTKPTGTGMGLAIVFGIVTRHGGTIEIESSRDAGTSVHLHLPGKVGTNDASLAGRG